MPFTVTKPQPNGKLYLRRLLSGDYAWTGAKSNATPMSEEGAEAIATEINTFASTPCQVEGIRHDDEVAPCE
jgi:hypothetical protein